MLGNGRSFRLSLTGGMCFLILIFHKSCTQHEPYERVTSTTKVTLLLQLNTTTLRVPFKISNPTETFVMGFKRILKGLSQSIDRFLGDFLRASNKSGLDERSRKRRLQSPRHQGSRVPHRCVSSYSHRVPWLFSNVYTCSSVMYLIVLLQHQRK